MESKLVQICIKAATKLFGDAAFEEYANSQKTVVPIMEASVNADGMSLEVGRMVVERWPWKRSYIERNDGTYIDLDTPKREI